MKTWIITIIIIVAGLAILPRLARGDAPPLLPVQGYLTNTDGVAIDGPTVLQITLYESAIATEALFTEPRSVQVTEGYFTVYVGEVVTLDLELLRELPELWLGIAINNDPELEPRVQIATTPFTAFSQYCGDATTLEGAIAADFAAVGHDHDWAELTGVPADIADGDADSGGDITSVMAGAGLTGGALTGAATLAVDPTVVQSRVSSTCAAGSAIRGIAADGSVTCETDDVGAAVIHTHGAAQITSGLLSTARYDAYDDLFVSGRLNNNASSDVLTRTQLDARYTNSLGDTMTGNLSTSGWFEYSPAKTVVLMLGPNQFRNISEADDTWHYQWNWGAGYISGGSAPYLVDLFATIDAPDQATISQITCWYRDNHATADISNMTFRLLGQSGGFAPTVYATSAPVTTTGRNSTILSQVLTTTRVMTTNRDWHLLVTFGETALGSLSDGPSFYGCSVTYSMTMLRP